MPLLMPRYFSSLGRSAFSLPIIIDTDFSDNAFTYSTKNKNEGSLPLTPPRKPPLTAEVGPSLSTPHLYKEGKGFLHQCITSL